MEFTVEQQEKIEEIKRAVYKSAVEKTEVKILDRIGLTKDELDKVDLSKIVSENTTLKSKVEELTTKNTELSENVATLTDQNEQYNCELSEFLEVKNNNALTDKLKDVFNDKSLEKALKVAKTMYGITVDADDESFNTSIESMKGEFPEYFKTNDTPEPKDDGTKIESKPIGGIFNL